MKHLGGCYCGDVRYEVRGDPINSAICHCRDCQKSSGAPSVGWIMLNEDAFSVTSGKLSCINGKTGAERYFCGECGTGIVYKNAEMLPGLLDVQTVTLDDPSAFPAEVNIQQNDQLEWHKSAHKLPGFDGYPPQE